MLGHDVVSQEMCLTRTGMGDQCFVLGQLQFEFIAQEPPQEVCDLPCFGLRSTESKENVISVPYIAKPTIMRILGILAGERAAVQTQCPYRCLISLSASTSYGSRDLCIRRVFHPVFPSVEHRQQLCLDI